MFETERLILRPFEEDDVDAVFAMRSDENVMRFIRPIQTKKDETLNWIRMLSEKWDTENIGFCAVVLKKTEKFVGWCGLWRLKETDEIEIGYAIAKDFQGKGYATEAARRILEYGFNELSLEKIVAVAYPENEASQNVMKRLGMKYVKTGEFYEKNLVQYAIFKNELQTLLKSKG